MNGEEIREEFEEHVHDNEPQENIVSVKIN